MKLLVYLVVGKNLKSGRGDIIELCCFGIVVFEVRIIVIDEGGRIFKIVLSVFIFTASYNYSILSLPFALHARIKPTQHNSGNSKLMSAFCFFFLGASSLPKWLLDPVFSMFLFSLPP